MLDKEENRLLLEDLKEMGFGNPDSMEINFVAGTQDYKFSLVRGAHFFDSLITVTISSSFKEKKFGILIVDTERKAYEFTLAREEMPILGAFLTMMRIK